MNTKDKIIEITFLLSLENGFDRVSIKQIQKESGVSSGSIYYYFKDKDDILVEILNRYLMGNIPLFKEAVRNSSDSLRERLRVAFILTTTSFNKKEFHFNSLTTRKFNHEDYFMLLTSIFHQYPEVRHMFHEMQHDLNDFYYKLLQEAIEKGEIREDIDIKTMNIFIQSCIKGHITLWLNQSNFSLEEIVKDDVKMIWEIIKK
ncbi:TetR/AcrR family transcriptional regulator [Methanobrevibacter sp. TMH8]|uniref:TetR/AcrR family transcriptional regulator n=1 Tax=Methanobrevibacter sp. TMH8 TaxID=2848611 RepID=UPI001CCFFF08|nr:TetR/AcrR family transcriptional regulator [Methanobrevibacter sp. TMH8]MBZ9570841.1 TetR/AcrR family transcriptional regulator [Methanobrevibacter sp. TMH8]